MNWHSRDCTQRGRSSPLVKILTATAIEKPVLPEVQISSSEPDTDRWVDQHFATVFIKIWKLKQKYE